MLELELATGIAYLWMFCWVEWGRAWPTRQLTDIEEAILTSVRQMPAGGAEPGLAVGWVGVRS